MNSILVFVLYCTPKNVRDCSHILIGMDPLLFVACISKDANEKLADVGPAACFVVILIQRAGTETIRDTNKFPSCW